MSHWENMRDEETSSMWSSIADQDMNAEEDSEILEKREMLNVGSYHCKSALRNHESNMLLFLYMKSYNELSMYTNSDPYNDEYLFLLPDLWRCFFLGSHSLSRIYDPVETKTDREPSRAFKRYLKFMTDEFSSPNYVTRIMQAECGHLFKKQVSETELFDIIFRPVLAELYPLYTLMVYFNLCTQILNLTESTSRPDVTPFLSGISEDLGDGIKRIIYNDRLYIDVCGQAVRIVTPTYDQIVQKDLYLNLADKVNERFNIMYTCHILNNKYTGEIFGNGHSDPELMKHVIDIISFGDDLISTHRNYAFELLGKFEAYCVSAILLHDNPAIWNNREFQDNLLNDDRKENPRLYPHAMRLCAILNKIPEEYLAEIHGLWRIWGHPIIDLEGGLKKMEATSLRQPNISKMETKIGERTFKLLYMRNYFKRHGHYPMSTAASKQDFDLYAPHMMDRDKVEYLANEDMYNAEDYISRRVRAQQKIDESSPFYQHKSWDNIHILQSFQIPSSMNLATMIKDKAISMNREELVESVELRNTVFDSTKRRGVLKWLSEQTYKIKDFLMSIDLRGMSLKDMIIGLYPKEREMKTKARFFSLMSYIMRMYVTITEELLGSYILKYFPMITMSDSLLDMIVRLYNMTTQVGVSDTTITYSMNIDFSKWNQNMRERTNAPIFEALDRTMGLRRVISRTHEIFKNSYIYLCSGEYIPTIIRGQLTVRSPFSRINDESGKEGLRQKGWTITTVCDIVSLAYTHKAKIELIGGGDNQVLTVTMRSPDTLNDLSKEQKFSKIRKRMENFRNSLAKKMDKRGLPLKLEETWISHRLLMYNKIMYLDGVPLKGRLKIASRLFSNSNEGIMTLGNISSTLGTGFQSLSAKDYTPCIAWFISRGLLMLCMSQFFMCNPISGTRRLDQQILLSYKRRKEGLSYFGRTQLLDQSGFKLKMNIDFIKEPTLSIEDLYILMLYYHKILGGPGIGTPYSYIMKGFPDPLSEGLSFNHNTCNQLTSSDIKRKIKNITHVKASNVKHWEHLLEDPVSINHDAPAHGVAALRSSAEKIIRDADIKNVKFKELTAIGDNEYLKDLSETLCKPDRLEPRLLHDIVGATIPGYVNTIISKVDQSTTLNKLASNMDVVSQIYDAEIEYLMFLAKKIRNAVGYAPDGCPTRLAQHLRNATWGKAIVGVTTPHPSAFLSIDTHPSGSHLCDQNYVAVHIKRLQGNMKRRGPFRPYFGSYTQEKFKQGQMAAAYGDEDVLRRAIKIQKLLRWRYQEESSMYRLIQSILRCVTDADPNKFLPTAEEITGDVEHRYKDMATKHGGIPTNLIHPYTFISCNTSTFINHSKGGRNETLHFQALIIYSGMTAYIKSSRKDHSSDMFHFHEICDQCIRPIDNGDAKDQEIASSIDLRSCPNNELIYVKEENIPVHYHHIKRFSSDKKGNKLMYPIINIKDDEDLLYNSCALLLLSEIIAKGDNMTESGFTLLLDNFEPEQLLSILANCIMYYSINSLKKPYNTITNLDIVDFYFSEKILVDKILNRHSMYIYGKTMGYIMTCSDDTLGLPNCPEILFDWRNYTQTCINVEHACVRLSDPQFTISYIMLRILAYPSTGICNNCSDIITKVDDVPADVTPSCSLHGDLVRPSKYHIHSTDSLIKLCNMPLIKELISPKANWLITEMDAFIISKGKRKIERDLEATTKNKKQRLDFLNSVGKTDDLSTSRSKLIFKKRSDKTADNVDRRKRRFMFKDITYKKIQAYFVFSWKKWDIVSTDYCRSGSRYSDDISLSPATLWNVSLPSSLSYTLNMTSSVHLIIQLILNKKKDIGDASPNGRMRIMMYLEWTMDQISTFPKIIQLLDASHKDLQVRDITFGIFVSKYTTIETNMEINLREMIHSASLNATMKKGHGIIIEEPAGTFYDPLSCRDNFDCVISDNPESTLWNNNDCFYVCSQGSVLKVGRQLRDIILENESLFRKCCILKPEKLISDESTMIIHTFPSKEKYFIDTDILVDVASVTVNQYDEKDVDCILAIISKDDCSYNITQDLVKQCKKSNGLITDDTTYKSIVGALGNSLLEFILLADSTKRLDWKSTMLIRVLVSIIILTHREPKDALSHFMQFNSISFSKKERRTLIMRKKAISTHAKMSYINGTNSIFGEGLAAVLREISTWMYIDYTIDHTLSHKISI